MRKRLTPDILRAFTEAALPESSPSRPRILESLSQVLHRCHRHSPPLSELSSPWHGMQASSAMDTDATETPSKASITASSLPEVEVYACLLAIVYLVDQKDYPQVGLVLRCLIEWQQQLLLNTQSKGIACCMYICSCSYACQGTS